MLPKEGSITYAFSKDLSYDCDASFWHNSWERGQDDWMKVVCFLELEKLDY